jgi:hypothetical protein
MLSQRELRWLRCAVGAGLIPDLYIVDLLTWEGFS